MRSASQAPQYYSDKNAVPPCRNKNSKSLLLSLYNALQIRKGEKKDRLRAKFFKHSPFPQKSERNQHSAVEYYCDR